MQQAPGVAGATKDRSTRTRPRGRWYGAVSLGYGPDGKTWRRHKVSGSTRAEVAEKLKALQAERDLGVQPSRAYTVHRAVDDWLAEGLDGRSARTVTLNRHILKPRPYPSTPRRYGNTLGAWTELDRHPCVGGVLWTSGIARRTGAAGIRR